MPNIYGEPTSRAEAERMGKTRFFPSLHNLVDFGGKNGGKNKGAPRCQHELVDSGVVVGQCPNISADRTTKRCITCGGLTLMTRQRVIERREEDEKRARRNIYTGTFPKEVIERAEEWLDDPVRASLENEVGVIRLGYEIFIADVNRRVEEGECNEDGVPFAGWADPATLKILSGIGKDIAEIAAKHNAIETSDRFIATPNAMKAAVNRFKTILNDSLNDAAGDNPTQEVVDVLAKVLSNCQKLIAGGKLGEVEEVVVVEDDTLDGEFSEAG